MVTKKRCLIIQKKDNGLPLIESKETSPDSKSEKSASIVAILEGNCFPFFTRVVFLTQLFFIDYVCNQADLDIIEPIKKSLKT